MKLFNKKIIKEDNKSEEERRAIYDMVTSRGWQISFAKAMEALRDIKDVRNVPDKNAEVEVRARQLFINMLEAHYEEIYGIIVNNQNVNEEDEGSEMYNVLSGNKGTDESEF